MTDNTDTCLLTYLPVLDKSVANGRTDEITILLQLIQSLLNCLVDGLLNGLTHPINLVHTAAWLNRTNVCLYTQEWLNGRVCLMERHCKFDVRPKLENNRVLPKPMGILTVSYVHLAGREAAVSLATILCWRYTPCRGH